MKFRQLFLFFCGLFICSSLSAQRWSIGGQVGLTAVRLAERQPLEQSGTATSEFGPGYQIDLTLQYQLQPWLHLRAEPGFVQLTNGFRDRIPGADPLTIYTSRDRIHLPLFVGFDWGNFQLDLGWETAYEFNRFGWSHPDRPSLSSSAAQMDGWYGGPTAALRYRLDRFVTGFRFFTDSRGGDFAIVFTNENGEQVPQSTTAIYGFSFTFGYVLTGADQHQ